MSFQGFLMHHLTITYTVEWLINGHSTVQNAFPDAGLSVFHIQIPGLLSMAVL